MSFYNPTESSNHMTNYMKRIYGVWLRDYKRSANYISEIIESGLV